MLLEMARGDVGQFNDFEAVAVTSAPVQAWWRRSLRSSVAHGLGTMAGMDRRQPSHGTGEEAGLPQRHAGRVIVLDPGNRVLLLRYDEDPPAGRHWATPGGGPEPRRVLRGRRGP